MSVQENLKPYAIHELVEEAQAPISLDMPPAQKLELQNETRRQEQIALELLRQTRDFLTAFYPEREIPAPDVFLRSLKNTETVTPYITLYKDTTRGDAPVAAIVAYIYRAAEGKGIGFVKYAAISPDYAKDEADQFLAGEIRECLFYITDKASSSGGEYRGTFLEVYAPNMDSTPSRKQLEALDAEPVNPGGYTVPTAPGGLDSYSLRIIDADEPDDITDAEDLATFLNLYGAQEGYGPARVAFRDVQTRVGHMAKTHIPILERAQTPAEKMDLAGIAGQGRLPFDLEP